MPKTSAFIGLAGPFGYDYRNPAPAVSSDDYSSPNPVLENVLGLLLCYDEILFLAPQFCPADMRDLPYVRFLSEDADAVASIEDALAAFNASEHAEWEGGASFTSFAEISEEMRGGREEEFAIDNHTHGLRIGRAAVTGDAMRLDNAVRDMWVAAELGLAHSDIIISSPAQQALNTQIESELVSGHYFSPEKRAAANSLVSLQVQNFLGPTGSYHEGLEAIRDRRDVAEFRQFLMEVDAPIVDGVKLADEISSEAFKTMDELADRYLGGKKLFRSVGVPALGVAGNMFAPGLGSAAAFALEAPHMVDERRFKARVRWAPFVIALNAPRG